MNMKQGKIIFITGGARSGKSSYALKLASSYVNKAYIATAQITDEEMKLRIEKHKAERDESYKTVEEPLDLSGALAGTKDIFDVTIIDCLTLWLSNLFLREEKERSDYINDYLKALRNFSASLIIISNELGMGIVPEHKLSRDFRDEMGLVNQKTAQIAHEAYFMVSGMPVKTK